MYAVSVFGCYVRIALITCGVTDTDYRQGLLGILRLVTVVALHRCVTVDGARAK